MSFPLTLSLSFSQHKKLSFPTLPQLLPPSPPKPPLITTTISFQHYHYNSLFVTTKAPLPLPQPCFFPNTPTTFLHHLYHKPSPTPSQYPFHQHHRYDPQTNRWGKVASMGTRRLGVGVAVLNGFLYAVGGSDGSAPLNTGGYLLVTIMN